MPPSSWDTRGSIASFCHATCILRYNGSVVSTFILSYHHPELPGVASLRQLRTNPRLHGRDSVSRTTAIDTIELLYSYLARMKGVAYKMHNVLCRSVTIEARFTASSRSSGPQQYWSALYGGSCREFGDDRNRRVFGMSYVATLISGER
jgi:hypothetical protein